MANSNVGYSSSSNFNAKTLLNFNGVKKVPLVLQSENTECGLACIAMISSFYGHKINLLPLRHHTNLGDQGVELLRLMDIANDLSLVPRALQCSLEEVTHLALPCILHWNLDHYVVLTKIKKGRYYINDPAGGERIVNKKQFSDAFTGIALELTPNRNFKKEDSRVLMKIEQLWGRIIGIKRSLIAIFSLSILIQILALLSPYYMQWIIDNVLLSHDKPLLLVLAIGFSFLKIIQVFISSFRSWFMIRLNCEISIQLASNIFDHLIRLPISFFEKRHVGDIVSRFGSFNAIKEMMTTGLVEAIIDGLMAVIILFMMYIYSPILSSVVLVFISVSLIVQYAFFYPSKRLEEESIVFEAKEDTMFLESVRSIQTLKLFGQETNRLNGWLNKYADVTNIGIRKSRLNLTENIITTLLNGFESILILYLGALIVIDGELTIGMLLAFIAYKSQFTSNISALVGKWLSFKMLSLHLERLSDITLEDKEKLNFSSEKIKTSGSTIRVEGLGFRYSESSEWIFRDVSFEVESGSSIAIVGPSGCGKSTLMKVILGLLEPTEGKIFFNDIDISQLSLSSYRQQFSAVMQNDSLLSGTIAENITMFDLNFEQSKLEECCKKACIFDEIINLPMRFNSLVGDMGSVFSGGQLQRIYLARALYRDPKVLCLDESSSHLDKANEKKVNQSLRELDITKIIIAHSAETINMADRVINLDGYYH
ncbi:peptidase domain-containing ABC transporter [Vibrio harveyi]|uniref:peptidase domain-containing ABC transporter n=1 Tax=Vibrio harveyi TaxID=669 RepID=UPI00040F42AB|nr:peptidase domain-containing ABC transporter [Vibrio harveyi]